MEFDFCDENDDQFLDLKEIDKCETRKAKILNDRINFINKMKFQQLKGILGPYKNQYPKFPVKLNDLRKISRKRQLKKKGMTFNGFVAAKIFQAKLWADTIMTPNLHDNNDTDGRICPDEWWQVGQQHRRLLKGYSAGGLEEMWDDYRAANFNEPVDATLDVMELMYGLDRIRRKWIEYHSKK